MNTESTYPGGSKSRVSKAGAAVRNGTASSEDLDVIRRWRAAHRPVLNTFQSILRPRTKGMHVIVAQRHKRRTTIFDKLLRFPKMELARMDNIAGCRLIFESVTDLRNFREKLHSGSFKHKRRNDIDKYDYILNPKSTGYRGFHDIYEYDLQSKAGKELKGLFIELQYRTYVQHAWATTVEVVGFVTKSQPKFQQGDQRFERVLALASEIFARAFESAFACFPDLPDGELVRDFIKLDKELGFMNLLRGLNAANRDVSAKQNVILIFQEDGTLETRAYRDATEALDAPV